MISQFIPPEVLVWVESPEVTSNEDQSTTGSDWFVEVLEEGSLVSTSNEDQSIDISFDVVWFCVGLT